MQNLFLSLSIAFFSLPAISASPHKDYGLSVGTNAPQIQTKDVDGTLFDLKKSLASGPVVLVFYRGGWCPYCNLQLRNLQKKVLPHIGNAKLVAVSVDKVSEGVKTQKTESLGFSVLSDPDAKILELYRVKYKVPEDLVKKYKSSYDIDLEKSSGKTHHVIAVPAVYVIAQSGKIAFAYVNENYKERADEKDIIAAVKSAK